MRRSLLITAHGTRSAAICLGSTKCRGAPDDHQVRLAFAIGRMCRNDLSRGRRSHRIGDAIN
jgi:hypothetical protein